MHRTPLLPSAPGDDSAGPLLARAGPAVVFTCLALGGVSALEMHHMAITHGEAIGWSTVLVATMPRWVLLAVTLPLVLHLGVIAAPSHPGPRLGSRVVLLHIALFAAISVPHAIVTAWSSTLANPAYLLFPWSARVVRAWYGTMPTVVALYAAVLVATWGIAESRERQRRTLRASQLETQLQAARLEALRAKLQPHFLYNTLNGIAALVAGVQPQRAVAAIEALGELLHAALRDDGRGEVAVHEELALAGRYLALQQMRFGARLQYTIDVSPSVADLAVPVLLLQPLVENAVVHGLEAGAERLHVAVTARRAHGGVELLVENDGTSPRSGPREAGVNSTDGSGVGLAATSARLATAYGDRASLRLLPREGGGASVRILIPRTVLATATAETAA